MYVSVNQRTVFAKIKRGIFIDKIFPVFKASYYAVSGLFQLLIFFQLLVFNNVVYFNGSIFKSCPIA